MYDYVFRSKVKKLEINIFGFLCFYFKVGDKVCIFYLR